MTGPQIWDSGPGSDSYFNQLAQFNATRDQFYQNLLNGINQRVAPQQVSQTPTPAIQQQGQPVTTDWNDPDLLGAARFWGMPEEVARHMPKDQLVAHLNALRQTTRPEEDTFAHRAGAAADMLLAVPEMFGIGAGEALTGLAQHLPLIGPRLAGLKSVHEADMFMRELEESVRSQTPESFQTALSSVNVIGNVAATFYPASGAWKLAGAPLGWVSSPLARAALQGAGSGYLLDGGSDRPAGAVAGGAVLGALGVKLAPAFEALATKISKQFINPAMLQNIEGESWPINRMNQSQTPGRPLPPDYLENWDVSQMGPKPSREEYAAFQENASRTLGMVAEQGRRSERQFFPSGYSFKGMSESTAEVAALQMNKSAAVVESPLLPTIAKQTSADDFSVVQALGSTNPGGSNIVEGILDPSSIARWNEVGHVGFAQRNGRLAAIVSDQPVTDDMISAFEKHGMYPSQQVLTAQGLPSTIHQIAEDGTATLTHEYSPMTFTRHVSELAPQMSSPGVHAVPDMWTQFQAYTEAQAIAAQHAMGGGLNTGQLEAIKTQNIPHYMEQFLDDVGVHGEGDRARIKNYFNHQWVAGFSEAAPEEAAQNIAIKAESEVATAVHPLQQVGQLDQLADTRGYVAIPNGEGGWGLRNVAQGVGGAVSPVEMSFQDAESAEAWLKKANRPMSDITPPSEVPIEVAGGLLREPQQLPNLNPVMEDHIVSSINELADAAGGVPPVPPEEVALLRASGNWGSLKNLWNRAAGFVPMRPRFAQISQAVRGIAGDDFGLAHDYDTLTNGLVQHHNIMHEPTNQLADILAPLGTKKMINGEWMRVWQIADDGVRAAKAQSLGWKPDEIQALDHFSQLVSNVAGEDINPELRKLVGTIAERQSIPELQQDAWQSLSQPSSTVGAWQQFASESNLNMRELDPRVFGESLIRSVMWQKNMAPTFDPIMEKWMGYKDDEGINQVSGFMRQWMNIMKQGYHPADDAALDAIHLVAQKLLGPSFTRQQARELVNFGMNTSHSAFLGYRVHVMARDALQLFFALPRAGGDLASVIGRYTTDPAYRELVWNESLREGAIQLTMPHRVAPGALGGELEQASAGMTPDNMSKRMQLVGSVGSVVRDMVPDVLKGSSDSVLKPLYLYGKQQELMRALVYRAGFEKAERALGAFRSAGAAADVEKLMGESGARTFDPAWQEEFKKLVSAGDDQRAAGFLGRQLADATQFKYGSAETPAIGRTVTGKLAMQFGSFQTQYLQYLRESLTNGSVGDKAKFLLTAGAVTGAAQAASSETGWNFNYMNPYAIGFMGGPAISMGAGLLQGGRAMADAFFNPDNQGIDKGLAAGSQALNTLGSALNPVSGLYATASGLGSAINDSPRPGQAIGRLLVTGERGALPDVLSTVHSADLAPSPNPVRQGGWALPQIPTLPAIYPFGVSNGQPDSGVQIPPNETPAQNAPYSYRPLPASSDEPIPFLAHPQPYQAASYSVDDVRRVLISQPSPDGVPSEARRLFAPDELDFLKSVQGVPIEQAVELFRGYMRDKLQSGQHQTTPDSSYSQSPFPGSGAMF